MQRTARIQTEKRSFVHKKQPVKYRHVGQSTKKQNQFGRLRTTPIQNLAFVHITTKSLYNRSITSVVLLTLKSRKYYVAGFKVPQLYPDSLTYDEMKQQLLNVFKTLSIVTFDSNCFTVPAIKKYFKIDENLIDNANKHELINKLRSLKFQELNDCTKQTSIRYFGLGKDSIKLLNGQKISKLWQKRFGSQDNVSLILAWSMMNALAIKYITFMLLGEYEQLKMIAEAQWMRRLEQLKQENKIIFDQYVNNQLKVDLSSEEMQSLIAAL